jgi:hypothetical protein
LKETTAGEGLTLFSQGINPNLAAFQKSYHLFWPAAQLSGPAVCPDPCAVGGNFFVGPNIDVARFSLLKELCQNRQNNVLI